MGRKSLISPAVISSDRYLGMSLQARELYPHLLTNSDPIGAVTGIIGIARGYGYQDPSPIIAELVENGYLVKADARDGETVYFISHWFTHNNKDASREKRSSYTDLAQSVLNDVRAPYRYREEKPSTVEGNSSQNPQPLSDLSPNTTQGNATQPNATELIGKEGNGRGSAKGEPEPRPIPCPTCGAETCQGQAMNGYVHVECMECGSDAWVNPETGDVRNDPYIGR